MKATAQKIRQTTLILIAIALAGVWAFNTVHIYMLEKELGALAKEKVTYLTAGDPNMVGVKVATLVTAAKEYAVFGATSGKIEVYFRRGENEYTLGGVEYDFIRENSEWVNTDSSQCSGADCQLRSQVAFASDWRIPVPAPPAK